MKKKELKKARVIAREYVRKLAELLQTPAPRIVFIQNDNDLPDEAMAEQRGETIRIIYPRVSIRSLKHVLRHEFFHFYCLIESNCKDIGWEYEAEGASKIVNIRQYCERLKVLASLKYRTSLHCPKCDLVFANILELPDYCPKCDEKLIPLIVLLTEETKKSN